MATQLGQAFSDDGFISFARDAQLPASSRAAARDSERRGAERLTLSIPIRVMGFDEGRDEVFENTSTIVVSRSGARIALQHSVFPDDVIRIINLENHCEADFRVVGPARFALGQVAEWGVECIERDRNIWELNLPQRAAAQGSEDGPMLECRACGQQEPCEVTPMETEVLDCTGIIARDCSACRYVTYWTYAEVSRRPRKFDPSEAVAPPPRTYRRNEQVEKRKTKRLDLQLPVLVRVGDRQEKSKTVNVSTCGFGGCLEMELEPGQIVKVFCPFTEGDQNNIEQAAEVRWADPYPSGPKRLYGFRFLR